jgi:hypothetical protein
MGVLFATSKDIRSTFSGNGYGLGCERPRCTGGTLDTLAKALEEIVAELAGGARLSCKQLYRASPSAKLRWPNSELQGAKAIERQLDAHGERLGIVRAGKGTGCWRRAIVSD